MADKIKPHPQRIIKSKATKMKKRFPTEHIECQSEKQKERESWAENDNMKMFLNEIKRPTNCLFIIMVFLYIFLFTVIIILYSFRN